MRKDVKFAVICAGDGLHARLMLTIFSKNGLVPAMIFNENVGALADRVSNFLIKDIASWPPPIAEQALDSGIPIKFLDSLFLDDNYLHRFAKSFDYLVCAGCPRVPASLVHSMPNRILNAHPGLLPGFRGLDPVLWALDNCCTLGATLHFVSEGFDSGPILIKENLKWQYPDNIFQCRLQCMELCSELVCRFLSEPWSYLPVKQSEKDATYWGSFPSWKEKDLLPKMLNYCFCEEHGNRYYGKK